MATRRQHAAARRQAHTTRRRTAMLPQPAPARTGGGKPQQPQKAQKPAAPRKG